MKIKQLCQNCGSEWETEEPQQVFNEITRKWETIQPEMCFDCIKDLENEN